MLRRGRGGNGDAVHANALLVIMRAHAKGRKGWGLCVCKGGDPNTLAPTFNITSLVNLHNCLDYCFYYCRYYQ